jgi:DNA polymerase-3 subunit gamma/tau
VQKVLPTILSRTQRYDFRRIQLDEIIANLRKIATADGIAIEDDALHIIAKKADGSMRDAQSIFDQAVAYCGMSVETARLRESLNLIDLDFYFEVTSAISAREASKAFALSGEVLQRGYDVEEFFSGLLEHFRNILTVSITGGTKLLEVSKTHAERYEAIAKDFVEGDLLRLIRLGQNALEKLRTGQPPRIVLEVSLVEMMILERALEISQLIEEVRALRGAPRVPGTGDRVPATPKTSETVRDQSDRSARTDPTAKPGPRIPDPGFRSPVPDTRPSAPDLENDAIASRWVSFGEFVRTKSRPLFSIFPEIEFCGVRKSIVYLSVTSKPNLDMLLSMKDEMMRALREFFGASLQFEAGARTLMQTKAGSPVVNHPEVVAQVTKPAKAVTERSELEMALIEHLGAQEV